jgi:hypothetical protein
MRFPRVLAVLAAAALSAALLAACGGNPKEQEPAVRDMLRDLARASVNRDTERILGHVVGPAGQGDNPIGAKEWDTPEGKKNIQEGNKRQINGMFKDSGITQEADVDKYLAAVKIIFADTKNCEVVWFIAPEGRRKGEKCTFRVTRTETGWKIYDYFRDLVN